MKAPQEEIKKTREELNRFLGDLDSALKELRVAIERVQGIVDERKPGSD